MRPAISKIMFDYLDSDKGAEIIKSVIRTVGGSSDHTLRSPASTKGLR